MPKRKAPSRKQARRNWLMSGVSAVASLAFNHPALSGGTAIFGIIFSFVAANALWYQPKHPHPLLDTRSAFRAYVARAATIADEDGAVTTFRIERQDAPLAQTPKTKAIRGNAPDTVGEVIVLDNALAGDLPIDGKASELVRQIQDNLSRRGLYDGDVDGLMGPRTEAAISFYQQTRGMEETGKPDITILNALKVDNAEFSIVPPDRPPPEITNAIAKEADVSGDDIANLIETNWTPPIPARRPERKERQTSAKVEPVVLNKPVEAKQTPAVPKQPSNASPALIMQIQQGLANLAYADIAVDGVAGAQTQNAISHFQKHYRLPVTGQADELVLEKLKQIGAL